MIFFLIKEFENFIIDAKSKQIHFKLKTSPENTDGETGYSSSFHLGNPHSVQHTGGVHYMASTPHGHNHPIGKAY